MINSAIWVIVILSTVRGNEFHMMLMIANKEVSCDEPFRYLLHIQCLMNQ